MSSQSELSSVRSEGHITFEQYSATTVHIKYRASFTKNMPSDRLWAVVRDSIYTGWDPIGRSACIRKQEDHDHIPYPRDTARLKPKSGPQLFLLCPPIVEFQPKDPDACERGRTCVITYETTDDLTGLFVAQTIHTLRGEYDHTVYELDEIFTLSRALEVVEAKVKASLTPSTECANWKCALAEAVREMGNAIMRRGAGDTPVVFFPPARSKPLVWSIW